MENERNERKEKRSDLIELIVVVLLGITAVATAWASWQGALHGSQQDQKYTKANHLNSEANSTYSEGMQNLNQDLMIWNQLMGLNIDLAFAEEKNDIDEIEKLDYKIDQILGDSISEEFGEAIIWAGEQEDYVSPFDNEEFVDTYFWAAWDLYAEAEEMMQAGDANNTHSDNQGLVTVIYAVVLFLLGITSTFKSLTHKYILLAVSVIGFILATVIMFTIPMVFP